MQIVNRTARRLKASARRFASDVRGNVAMIFALVLPVLLIGTLGGVDIHRASTVRMNLQDALDAATLAAARSPFTSEDDLTRVGLASLQANLAPYDEITLVTAQTRFHLTADARVIGDAKVDVRAVVANVILPPYGQLFDDKLPVNAHTEVNRSSKNVEVGLVLDVTGSMGGQRLTDLKAAATQLVGIVVQPTQSPYTTRMAIIPYSIGVNMGSDYANAARGAPTQSRAITGASWAAANAVNINGITRASPGVVTTQGNHSLVTNDFVWIAGVSGMTQVNNRAYRVVRLSNTTFSLQSWNGSSWAAVNTTSGNGYSAYSTSSGDTVRKCQVSDCTVVITSANHGIPATTNDTGTTRPGTVRISGVNGMTQINGAFEVANVTTNTYSLVGVVGPNASAYTSGGLSWCGQNGCEYRVFRRASDNVLTAFRKTTCVSERTGSEAYTDAAPSTAFVGRNYADPANDCPDATILPLTASISTLKTKISGLAAEGSTAGQIGLAWGWYAISPSFNALWSGSASNPHSERDTIKAVIMMTDGEFNTPYCTGVLARDAGYGTNNKITCNATNGDPFNQSTELCDAMKASGVVVYTVGFQITPNSRAAAILADCATDAEHAFLPASGADLTEDFAEIGRDITRLRISR